MFLQRPTCIALRAMGPDGIHQAMDVMKAWTRTHGTPVDISHWINRVARAVTQAAGKCPVNYRRLTQCPQSMSYLLLLALQLLTH